MAGDLMVIKGRPANAGTCADNWANALYLILHTDQILEVRDSGSQIFD